MSTETNKAIFDSIEFDNAVKLEKYYNGRRLRRYIQLLELTEQIVRSKTTNEFAKAAARTNADHYKRMIVSITMKPFDPSEITTDHMNDKIFVSEVARLTELFDPDYKVS